jgi:Mg-chelatase subunit ChlD
MIRFQYPELFLLAIPAWFAFRRWGKVSGATGWLRLTILGVLLLALSGPEIDIFGRGLDVVVVVDRSRSLPDKASENILELIQNLDKARKEGDRVGLVTFGGDVQPERLLSHDALFREFTREVLPDGSDLNEAVATALNLVTDDRPARILVLSDGESNGPSPLSAARRAREQGVPIDFRLFERVRIGDIAIQEVELPRTVSPLEQFQFSVIVHADRATHGTLRVFRDGEAFPPREHDFVAGRNRLVFRDILGKGGFYNYTFELDVPNDPLIENNRGAGLVRVDAGPKLLLLTSDGNAQGNNFAAALRAANLPVDVREAKTHPLTQDALDEYRGVIIENVPARDFGRLKMERLAQFVEDLGGGLMLTGGQRSFGTGGYFKSPLDEILPVSMEMREEHRKTRVAIVVALDRSGSMTAPVKGGKTKMDLANLGTAECVKLLSPGDSVAVIAVDSSPHIIQALTPVEDSSAIVSKVMKIESMGGGIFVYEALIAAGKELAKADQSTRHIILFSDAADSEEPGDYKKLLTKFEASGITVSVIGLGTKADVDSKLLEDIAKRGHGNIMFTSDAKELPRLFTEDTMSVARSTFVEADPKTQPNGIPGAILPDARLIANLAPGAFPGVGGYNLSYLKKDATVGVVSQDDYLAPWSAFWYRGLGRTVALTLEVDGQHTGRFANWNEYADFLVTHARWLLQGDDPNNAFVELQREGQDAVVRVELDPQRPNRERGDPPNLVVVPPGDERDDRIEPEFIWVDADTLEARFRMDRTGSYRTIVQTGPKKFTRGPAVTLPYSPEHVPRVDLPTGRETLEEMARISAGTERADVLEILVDPPRAARTMSLLPPLFILAMCLIVIEIAGRRLSLWERAAYSLSAEGQADKKGAGWLPKWKLAMPKRERKPAPAPKPVATTVSQRTSEESKSAPEKPAVDVYAQAKQRAKRRLK